MSKGHGVSVQTSNGVVSGTHYQTLPAPLFESGLWAQITLPNLGAKVL